MNAPDLGLLRGYREDGPTGELLAQLFDELCFTIEHHPLDAGLGRSAHRRGHDVVAHRSHQHGHQVGGASVLHGRCDLRHLSPGIVLRRIHFDDEARTLAFAQGLLLELLLVIIFGSAKKQPDGAYHGRDCRTNRVRLPR